MHLKTIRFLTFMKLFNFYLKHFLIFSKTNEIYQIILLGYLIYYIIDYISVTFYNIKIYEIKVK